MRERRASSWKNVFARLETDSALKQGNSSQDKNYEFEDVDKAVAVVGGFVDKTVEELEALVEEI